MLNGKMKVTVPIQLDNTTVMVFHSYNQTHSELLSPPNVTNTIATNKSKYILSNFLSTRSTCPMVVFRELKPHRYTTPKAV